jgi:hypothetical protein
MTEWSNTKIMGLAIEGGEEEAVDFNPESLNPEGSRPACPLACELPLRYGLPCKHWMYPAFEKSCQLPLSLFHPRWLFDGPAVLHERWQMSWKTGDDAQRALSPARAPNTSRSRFHGRGEEMVKGAAMETVLLLRQCPPSVAENYAVAVRDMNAVLLEKQQQLLARAEETRLELPPPLPQPNAREFPTSRKRKMTGFEAAIQEERDALVRCRRDAKQAQEDEDHRLQYREEAVSRIIERHSQQQQSPPPSASDSDSDSDSDSETGEPERPRRGVRRTQKLIDNSQTTREMAARSKPMKRRLGKKALAAAAEMSQLLDAYVPPPSSAVLLDK